MMGKGLASGGLMDRLESSPWWWSITAGILLLALSYTVERLGRKAESDSDSDSSCLFSVIAILFAVAGAIAVVSGLFGW